MAERPDTTKTVEQSPDMSHTPDAPSPTPERPPFWRRLVRRDAGFGVLVLLALLVTVLVISRLPSASTPTTARQPGGTATPATQSAQSGAIVQRANAQIIPMPTSRAGLMQPAVDAQGNIWVGEMVTNQLARIDPKTGQVTEWTPPGGKYNIMATAMDRQGDVWFTEQAANYIGRFDPTTQTFQTYPLDTAIAPRMAPQDLAFDANGQLWFTLLGGRIGRLDPATGAMRDLACWCSWRCS